MRFIAAFTIVTLSIIKQVHLSYRDARLSSEPKKILVGREDTISNVVKTLLQRAPHDEIFLHSTNGATLLPFLARTNFTIAPKNHLISKFGLSPLSRVLDHFSHPLANANPWVLKNEATYHNLWTHDMV